ncbi:MAG TPA: DUF3568 family protein [Planctomycetota bacterium]|jgi:hypothetical protein|nr:DUF3568 family protein [Planctomycetota bacterium]
MNARKALFPALLLGLTACRGMGIFGTEAAPRNGEAPANAAVRRYPRSTEDVWSAVAAAMQSLDLRIESDRHDALGGELVARRANDERVSVRARSLDEASTQVTVSVGAGDRNLAEIVQNHIGRHLGGAGVARTGFFGGSTLERSYDANVAKAVIAAERAAEELGLEITHRDIRDASAEVVARKAGVGPVLVRVETAARNGDARRNGDRAADAERGPVRVTFVAGTRRSEENEALLQDLRTSFERFLR